MTSKNQTASAECVHDDETTIATLRGWMQTFVDERHWQRFHNLKNLSMSLSIEVGELMEHTQWLDTDELDALADDPRATEAIAEEVADCLSYLLSIANTMDIDLASTLRAKMQKNRIKYPIGAPGRTEPDTPQP